MKSQDFNKELLDYLYGEMSSEEMRAFESKMAENEELRQEFDELNAVRQELGTLQDKEVMEPFSALDKKSESAGWLVPSRKKILVFRPITAVAASLLALMLVGYLTHFSLSINNQGIQIGYGNQIASQENYLGANAIRELVNEEVNRNNEIFLSKLSESQNSYDLKLASLESSVEDAINANKKNMITGDELQKFFLSMEQNNKEMMKEYLKLTSAQQQEYFKTMLSEFNTFLQEQRNEDLKLIRNSLIDIKQDQDLQKRETDQAIASLFTSVIQRNN